MSKLRQAVADIHVSDNTDSTQAEGRRLHPLSRLLITLLYIGTVISFPNDNVMGIAAMGLYLLVQAVWHGISVRAVFLHVWPVFLVTGAVGAADLALDREVSAVFGSIVVTHGMLSMVTLMMKGLFCVAASYLLTVAASIRQICYALRLLHVPEEIVSVVMLMHRYLIVCLKEVERMQQAYRLRAPNQKGLRFRSWGSFVGLLLLRSMDRAQEVYESMELRGFCGRVEGSSFRSRAVFADVLAVLFWGSVFFLLRVFPVFQMVGNLFL